MGVCDAEVICNEKCSYSNQNFIARKLLWYLQPILALFIDIVVYIYEQMIF